jgi:hypothetical protein
MIETLAQIDAPHFCAGIVLWNDRVVEAASIVQYMRRQKWSRDRVRSYCAEKGWKVAVVHEVKRND